MKTIAYSLLVLLVLGSTAQCHRLATFSGKKHNKDHYSGGSCQVAVQNIDSAVDACDAAVHAIPGACKVWEKNVTFNHCWKSIKSAGSSIEEVKTDVSIALDNCAGALLCVNALHEVSDAADLTDAAEDTAIGACAVPEPVEPELCGTAVGALIVSVGHLAVKVADAVEKCTATPHPVTPAPSTAPQTASLHDFTSSDCGTEKSSSGVTNGTCYPIYLSNGACASEMFILDVKSYQYLMYGDTACGSSNAASTFDYSSCATRPLPTTCGEMRWMYPYIQLVPDTP